MSQAILHYVHSFCFADANLFLDAFVQLDVAVLKDLNLHEHILSERGTRLSAFHLVSIIEEKSDVQLAVLYRTGCVCAKSLCH